MFVRPNGISKLVIGILILVCITVLTVVMNKSARLQRIGVKVKHIIEEEASYYDENLLLGAPEEDDHFMNEEELAADYQEVDMRRHVKETIYNMSPFYFDGMKLPKQYNRTCAYFPNFYHLFFNNIYYQMLESSNGTFQLYGAYYDTRNANPDVASVRILGQVDMVDPVVSLYCQLWYKDASQPVVVPVQEVRLVWNKNFGMMKMRVYYTYLISCVVPEKSRNTAPLSVSLVEKYCDTATNNLKVNYEVPNKKEMFAVCVKGLDFQRVDLSVRLAEWIELLTILGASKVTFYNLHSHPKVVKLLQYYQSLNVVDFINITLAGYQPNFDGYQHYYMINNKGRKRQNELVTYNDCFYRNMYKYDYIILLDIDEIIVPNIDINWKQLMERTRLKVEATKAKERASYAAQNVYFLDKFMNQHELVEGVPDKYHMLQHIYRTANYSVMGSYNKCFLDTDLVMTLHNHFPLSCFGKCANYHIGQEDAQLNHYRDDCYSNLKSCQDMKKNMVQDKVVHKYKEELIKRVGAVLRTVSLL